MTRALAPLASDIVNRAIASGTSPSATSSSICSASACSCCGSSVSARRRCEAASAYRFSRVSTSARAACATATPGLELQRAPVRLLGEDGIELPVGGAERAEVRGRELRVAHRIASWASWKPAATLRNVGSSSANRSSVHVPTTA